MVVCLRIFFIPPCRVSLGVWFRGRLDFLTVRVVFTWLSQCSLISLSTRCKYFGFPIVCVCDEFDCMFRSFIWSNSGATRGCHLVNWSVIILPNACGGMGQASKCGFTWKVKFEVDVTWQTS